MKAFFGPLALTTEMPSFSQKNSIKSNVPHIKPAQLICLSPSSYNNTNNNSILSLLSELSKDCEYRTELPIEPQEGKKLCEQFPCLCSLALPNHTEPENEGD